MDPVYSFRSHFTYNNTGYGIASQIVAQTSKMSWERFCKERIFDICGMKRTTASYKMLMEDTNVAMPHLLAQLRREAIPFRNWDDLPAAGGINSCASDMARWLKVCLSNSSSLIALQKPESLMEVQGFLIEETIPAWDITARGSSLVGYGYGWMSYMLDNKLVLFHTGLSDGMQSVLAIIPEEELGIAILTNQMNHLGADALLNEFLHRKKVHWHKKAHAVMKEIDKKIAKKKSLMEYARNKNAPAHFPLSAYSGKYEHPAYGLVDITEKNEALEIKLFSQEEGLLQHWQDDQFLITKIASGPLTPWIITFQISQDQKKVSGFTMPNLGAFERKEAP